MSNVQLDFKLSVIFLKEGDRYVAYSPALDLSTSGESQEQARKRFVEAALLFFQEIYKRGTAAAVLEELGWKRENEECNPPVIVGQESEFIRVPVAA